MGLRIKKLPNLVNVIRAMKSLAADHANVNGHRHTKVKPGTHVSNTVKGLDGKTTDGDMESIAIFDNWWERTTKNSVFRSGVD